jgi:hypothetical protein
LRALVAMILTAVGVYAVLAVVLILEATVAGLHGLVLPAVPGVLFFAAAVSLFASYAPVRRRLAAFKTWFLDVEPLGPSPPRTRSMHDA